MKRKITFLTAAFALLAFLAIPMGMWGQTRAEEVYSTCLFGPQYNSQSVGSYTATWTTTNGDFTWTIVNGNNNNNNWNYVKFGRKNNVSVGQIKTGAAYSEAVTKVDLTIDAITANSINSIKLYTSSDNTAWTEAGSFNKSTGLQTVTLANPAVNLYYKIEFDCASGSANGLVTVSKVEYYYNTGGANSPTITAEDVEIDYDATSGIIAYTVNNPVAGGAMSANTTSDWLTLGTVGTTVPFTCAANQGAIRTAVVTLTYSYGNDNVTKNVTVTQDADPNGPGSQANPYTVAQARAAIDASTGTQGVYATGIVSSIPSEWSAQYNNITFNMVDEVGDQDFLQAFRCVSSNNVNASAVAVGDIVVVYGNLTLYTNSNTGETTYEFAQGCQLVSLTHSSSFVAAPTFNPAAGTYAETQTVAISCETPNVDIYYTVDGTDPDDESTPYGGLITVSGTTTIKAVAYDSNDNNSAIATATYHINSQDSPYTVAQALEFADYQYPANGIYVHGIVSTAPTQSPTNNGELTYYISDNGEAENQLEVYKGKGLEQAAFESQNDIQVGDIVTIYGNVVIYGTTNPIKEFAQGNYLVSFERPANTEPSITVNPTRVDVPFAEANGTLTVTYQNIEMELQPEIVWFESDGETQAEECGWIHVDFDEDYNVNYMIDANTGDARMAYMKIHGVDAELNDVYSDLITFSQGHFFVDYATLPFAFDGGRADIANTDGLTAEGLGTDYNNSPKLKFDNTDDWMILHFEGTPGTLTFDIKGNTFSGGTFTVQTSEDGETYTDLATYSELGAIQHEEFNNLGENVRYVKWVYTEKSTGNVALGNIVLTQYTGPVASITVDPSTVNVDVEGGEGTLTVNYENITEVLAEVQFFAEDGETPATYEWITASVNSQNNVEYLVEPNDGAARTAYMKVYALNDEANGVYSNLVTITQAAYVAPFAPVTYTLATTIESGKSYIIVGVKELQGENHYYAMGEQRNNNRAGVEISVDGTIATVETAAVHEVVITALEENGFYSIYDGGYLYAAGFDKNYLRTQDTLDVNAQWSISIDTLFHIVADSSLNRNVMQFNYNGGSPLFSCYATDNQSPVYLYVKEETPTTVTQTIALEAGQNWVSFYVDIELENLETALTDVLGTSGISITIQSQTQTRKFTRGRWSGTLDFDLAHMYTINVPQACEIAVTGMPLDPADLPININRGTNWIAFPFAQSMTLTEAFAGFAITNDQVSSQTGSSKFSRNKWNGQVINLEPGKGYIYNSATTETRTFFYPASSSNAAGKK